MTNPSSRFAPLRDELVNIRDQVNKIFEDTFSSGSSLPLDIYTTDEHVVITTGALLGLQTDSLDISISDGSEITISGETAAPDSIPDHQYIRRERKFGAFSRMVNVPVAVVAEEAKATYKDSVLTITIPKAQVSGPKVVKVTPLD